MRWRPVCLPVGKIRVPRHVCALHIWVALARAASSSSIRTFVLYACGVRTNVHNVVVRMRAGQTECVTSIRNFNVISIHVCARVCVGVYACLHSAR